MARRHQPIGMLTLVVGGPAPRGMHGVSGLQPNGPMNVRAAWRHHLDRARARRPWAQRS